MNVGVVILDEGGGSQDEDCWVRQSRCSQPEYTVQISSQTTLGLVYEKGAYDLET